MGLTIIESDQDAAPRVPPKPFNHDEAWLKPSLDRIYKQEDTSRTVPLEVHKDTDTSTLSDQTKLDMQMNMLAHFRSIRSGHAPEKEAGADGTYNKDGGSYTLKDGRVTELTMKDGSKISDIKHREDGEILSATMPDGSKLQPNFKQNEGLIDGWHQDGYKLVKPDGTSERAPFNHAFADSTGFTTTYSGSEINTTTLSGTKGTMSISSGANSVFTTITTASGEEYRNAASNNSRN